MKEITLAWFDIKDYSYIESKQGKSYVYMDGLQDGTVLELLAMEYVFSLTPV